MPDYPKTEYPNVPNYHWGDAAAVRNRPHWSGAPASPAASAEDRERQLRTTPRPYRDDFDPSVNDMVVMRFTPEDARLILETRNTRNRPFRPPSIQNAYDAILAGEWRLNGETLKFDTDGVLQDGQNRLAACVRAGVPLVTWVGTGFPPENYSTIDRGARKTTADDMTLAGERNAVALAAVTSVDWNWTQGRRDKSLLASLARSEELFRHLAANPGLRRSVSVIQAARRGSPVKLPYRLAAFVHYRGCAAGFDDASDAFVDGLYRGVGLEPKSPVLVLRNAILTRNSDRDVMSQHFTLALTIKCWRRHVDGGKITVATWRSSAGEPFPEFDAPGGQG